LNEELVIEQNLEESPPTKSSKLLGSDLNPQVSAFKVTETFGIFVLHPLACPERIYYREYWR
jgi:hypothetical protein